VTVCIQPHPAASGRNRERRNRRDAIPTVTVPQQGSFAHGCPCFTYRGDEQKTAFVQKRQVCAPFQGFFLSWAMSNVSNWQWPPRRAAWRVVPAFANSNTDRQPVTARHRTRHIGSRSAPRPTCPLSVRSIDRWNNPRAARRAAIAFSRMSSVVLITDMAARASVVASAPADRHAGTPDTIAPQNSGKPAPVWRPREKRFPLATSRSPDDAVVPTLEGFHMVSCPFLYHI